VFTLLSNGVAKWGLLRSIPNMHIAPTPTTRSSIFNGGTLRATATTSGINFFDNILTAAYVRDGGAIIDSSNYNITIVNRCSTAALAADQDRLRHADSGWRDTCVGATVVSKGTLALSSSGSIASSSGIAISGGATFDVMALTTFILGANQT